MRTCNVCGGEIEFRYMNGGPTPIHLSGGCYGGEGNGYEDSGYAREERPTDSLWGIRKSYAAPASCPKCGAPVFFVRHNDGSVWLDDLGWPWPKHGCFVTAPEPIWASFLREAYIAQHRKPSQSATVGTEEMADRTRPTRDEIFVGIVVAVRVLYPKSATGLVVVGAHRKRMCVAIEGDTAAGSFLECVVMINLSTSILAATNQRRKPLLPIEVRPEHLGLPRDWLR